MKFTTILIAAFALATGACSTNSPKSRPACPTAQQMDQPELIGSWSASLRGVATPVRLELGPHPEWDGTVKGSIIRAEGRSIVVGDVNQGKLTLEESADGKKVSGTWLGDVVEGSCGREIRGDWLDAKDASIPFVMTKNNL